MQFRAGGFFICGQYTYTVGFSGIVVAMILSTSLEHVDNYNSWKVVKD